MGVNPAPPLYHAPVPTTPEHASRDLLVGILSGLGAQAMWGFSILYFKAVAHIAPLTVVSHRALWGLPLIVALALATGGLPRMRGLLADRAMLAFLPASAVLLGINWLGFVWCVVNGEVLQTALAYFITPLMMAGLGVFVLGERLRILQKAGLTLSSLGVLLLIVSGVSPWMGLIIGGSWAIYSLIRRARHIPAIEGLSLELILLALAGSTLLATTGFLPTVESSPHTDTGNLLLLMLGGPVTAAPLLLFGIAARRLPLTTLGFIQYFGPTIQFLLAVFVYAEPFTLFQAAAYGFIWMALILFTIDSRKAARRARAAGGSARLSERDEPDEEDVIGTNPAAQPVNLSAR